METYKVRVNCNGEVFLPPELRDELGLIPDDTLELRVDTPGALLVRATERSVGPLGDFFEDFILQDLRCDGCSGDSLKAKFLERKIQLSRSMDRLTQEGYRSHKHRQSAPWREAPELKSYALAEEENGSFQVVITARAERELRRMPERAYPEVAVVLESLEWDPTVYKRLRGPYYETYRVAFREQGQEHYRIVYTVFAAENLVVILNIGERQYLYELLKGLVKSGQLSSLNS